MVQNRNIDVETIKDSVKEVKGKDILEEIEFANGKTIKIDGVFVAEGIAKYSIALPAGLVGDERIGESVEDAIKAELLEEAGLVADRIEIKSHKVASSPGCVSETVTLAIAYINEYNVVSKPVSDGGVIVDRILVDKKDVYKWLRAQEADGIALTASTLACLFYLNEEK